MSANKPHVVLVVEDEPLVLLIATTFIEEAGYEVVSATNADEAVLILEARTDIRIVFSDIDMPGSMDGMKLANAVRGRWPPIELILTSGRGLSVVDLPARGRFFAKPYLANEIIRAMDEFVAAAA
jgi:CheY-like chemotaxis protein